MNKNFYFILAFLILVSAACKNEPKEQPLSEPENSEVTEKRLEATENQEPWTQQQLLEPRDLAQLVQKPDDSLVILSLGAGGIIPGSKDTGPTGEKQGLENLEKEVKRLPRHTDLVLYCGCCPFDICPNVRPAFSLLNEMGFTNHQLLNLRENIKVDWIDRGYPTAQ